MSDTILGGDFTVYYLDDNRQKRIEWTGSAAGTRTMNELYSALQDHFDELLQMDDGTPMSAETPVEYTIGIIDSGDNDPWFINLETMEHLTGGALKTASWTRVQDSNTGIVVVAVTSNDIDDTDIGDTVDNATDTGTLLDFIEAGTTDYLVIRPTNDTVTHNWDSSSGTVNCASSAHSATQDSASVTGEQIWANIYSIGTIEFDSHIYLYQGDVADESRARKVSVVDTTQDWWSDGHIDICVSIKDYTTDTFPVIDGGYISVFARKYTTLFDNFEVANSITSGGRNPIPLATAPDLDNATGFKSITLTGGSGNWNVGDEIQDQQVPPGRAIITQIDNPGATATLHYFLIDDPLTDLQTSDQIDNQDDSGSGDEDGSGSVDQGPALTTWFTNNAAPTAVYANTTVDINNDGTAEGYGITLDCNDNPLTEVYEWIKYIFRRGETSTTNSDGIEAEQYVGGTVFLEYSGAVGVGTIEEGDDVSQATSLATGIVISHDTTLKQILLRDTRGTFSTSYLVTSTDNAGTITPDTTTAAFAAKKAAPLGTFAGGTFFGARGVVLENWLSPDENSFQLVDSQGVLRARPTAIALSISNLIGTDETTLTDDRVAMFRLTGLGGDIDKTEYSAAGGESIGDATLVVDAAIDDDVPGKTTGGVLRIRDESDDNQEYRIRFSSWDTSTFTLANIVPGSLTAGTDESTLVSSTDELDGVKRGDLVLNVTRTNAISYVTDVDAASNTVNISPVIPSQVQGDTIEINACPVAVDTLDDVYVSLVDQYATSAVASVSLIYVSPIYFRVKVRNVAHGTPIKPFSQDGSTSGTDQNIATIRTPDTIYT